jgi:mono/diheme cytochrome c family protein
MTFHRGHQTWRLLVIGTAAALAIAGTGATGGSTIFAQGQPRTVWNRVYSRAQARRGEQAYKTSCGYCHKDDLSGGFLDDGVGKAAALSGPQAFGSSFAARWKEQSVGDFVYVIASTMPKNAPTSLSLETYVDIASYILEKNDVPSGETDLSADVAGLREIAMTPGPR